jgi:hypothetical protein
MRTGQPYAREDTVTMWQDFVGSYREAVSAVEDERVRATSCPAHGCLLPGLVVDLLSR